MDSPKPSEAPSLAAPALVVIKLVSPRGPWARQDGLVVAPRTQISLANISDTPLNIHSLVFDPLQLADAGTAVQGQLSADTDALEIEPGHSVLLTLCGQVQALPATYGTTLRVAMKEGARLAIRVELRVAAAPRWGLACMLLGLSMVGVLTLLDGESGVRGQLRQLLTQRQATQEFLQRSPPPQNLLSKVERLNREYDSALAILQQPRSLSFVDHRRADAQEHMDLAKSVQADLRKTIDGSPRGAIELADLTKEWVKLREQFDALAKRYPTASPQGPASALPPGLALSDRLAAFDAWAAGRLLAVPLKTYRDDFENRIIHLQMLYAAGQPPVAAADAVAVRRWMQRAADVVDMQTQRARFFADLTTSNLATVQSIRGRVQSAGLAPLHRAAILAQLDEAAAAIVEPFEWSMRSAVNQRILSARSGLLSGSTQATLAAAQAARAQNEAEDSIADVEAVLAQGQTLKRGADNKIEAVEKTKWLRRMVAAWRLRIATATQPDASALQSELAALEAANEFGDMAAVEAHARGMFQKWAAHSSARAKAMVLKTTAPFCLSLRDDALTDLETSQASMRRLGAHAKLQAWESLVDQLTMQARAAPDVAEQMSLDCLAQLTALSDKANKLSNEIDSALWDNTVLPDASKRQLAIDLRGSLTPATLRNLVSDVRPLVIEITTPALERHVGREIEFKITNLDPLWGPGVAVALNFGDGKIMTMSAEELRQAKTFTHVYAVATSVAPAAAAGEAFKPNTLDTLGRSLGWGEMPFFTIAPSPVSVVRQLADNFFNARFGLALLIASLLYFWRYHSSKTVFGANPYDYAQAFALGFVVSVAVNELPKRLADFIKS